MAALVDFQNVDINQLDQIKAKTESSAKDWPFKRYPLLAEDGKPVVLDLKGKDGQSSGVYAVWMEKGKGNFDHYHLFDQQQLLKDVYYGREDAKPDRPGEKAKAFVPTDKMVYQNPNLPANNPKFEIPAEGYHTVYYKPDTGEIMGTEEQGYKHAYGSYRPGKGDGDKTEFVDENTAVAARAEFAGKEEPAGGVGSHVVSEDGESYTLARDGKLYSEIASTNIKNLDEIKSSASSALKAVLDETDSILLPKGHSLDDKGRLSQDDLHGAKFLTKDGHVYAFDKDQKLVDSTNSPKKIEQIRPIIVPKEFGVGHKLSDADMKKVIDPNVYHLTAHIDVHESADSKAKAAAEHELARLVNQGVSALKGGEAVHYSMPSTYAVTQTRITFDRLPPVEVKPEPVLSAPQGQKKVLVDPKTIDDLQATSGHIGDLSGTDKQVLTHLIEGFDNARERYVKHPDKLAKKIENVLHSSLSSEVKAAYAAHVLGQVGSAMPDLGAQFAKNAPASADVKNVPSSRPSGADEAMAAIEKQKQKIESFKVKEQQQVTTGQHDSGREMTNVPVSQPVQSSVPQPKKQEEAKTGHSDPDKIVHTNKEYNLGLMDEVMNSIHDQASVINGEHTGVQKEAGVTVFKHAMFYMVTDDAYPDSHHYDLGALRSFGDHFQQSNFSPSKVEKDTMFVDFLGGESNQQNEHIVGLMAKKINSVLGKEAAQVKEFRGREIGKKIYSIKISPEDLNTFVESEDFHSALNEMDPRNIEFFNKPYTWVDGGPRPDLFDGKNINLAPQEHKIVPPKTGGHIDDKTQNGGAEGKSYGDSREKMFAATGQNVKDFEPRLAAFLENQKPEIKAQVLAAMKKVDLMSDSALDGVIHQAADQLHMDPDKVDSSDVRLRVKEQILQNVQSGASVDAALAKIDMNGLVHGAVQSAFSGFTKRMEERPTVGDAVNAYGKTLDAANEQLRQGQKAAQDEAEKIRAMAPEEREAFCKVDGNVKTIEGGMACFQGPK